MTDLDRTAEQLADSLRALIAALEEPPTLGHAEANLLHNLRRTLAEWEAASFTCPRCGMTSYLEHDVDEGYCGNCHDWTGDRSAIVVPSSPNGSS